MIKDRIIPLGFLFFLLVSYSGFCQEKIIVLKGKVQSVSKDVSDVLVINLNTKESTITDSKGLFTLEVKLNDSIQLSALQFIEKKILITGTIINQKTILVDLIQNVVKLEEVTVRPYNLTGKMDLDIEGLKLKPTISALSLGLPNSDIKVMTYHERLLLVADRGEYGRFMTIEEKMKQKNIFAFLTIGVILNPEKIINRLSGKTKSLEDMVSSDEISKLENQIISMFSKTTISKELKIPQANVDGFLSFCLAQNDFPKLSDGKNALEIWEYLEDKSKEYKKIDNLEEIVKTH